MTIEQRVAKLERQNRWMKRMGGLALATGACVVLMGQGKDGAKDPPSTIRAKRFILIDEKGRERAKLSMYRRQRTRQPSPALVLYDTEHFARVVLIADTTLDDRVWPTLKLVGGEKKAKGDVPGVLLRASETYARLTVGHPAYFIEIQGAANAPDAGIGIYAAGAKVIWKAPPK